MYLFRRKLWKTHNLYSSNRKKVARIDKNWEEITKNISYKLWFIDGARFMASSLSNLVNNLSEGLHRIKCKLDQKWQKCESCGIKCRYWEGSDIQTLKMIQ